MESKFVRVFDSSATSECPVRNHQLIIGGQVKNFEFKEGEGLRLPFDIGMKFMQVGFTVKEDDDDVVIDRPAETQDAVRFQIGEDEVVARYSELTTESLKLRAVTCPGGEKFLVQPFERSEIIHFIKTASAPDNVGHDETIDGLDDLLDDAEEVDLASLPGANVPLMPATKEINPVAVEVELKMMTPDKMTAVPAANAAGLRVDPEMETAEAPKLPDFASDEAAELTMKLNADGNLSTAAISQIKGTGKDGEITVADVKAAAKTEAKGA